MFPDYEPPEELKDALSQAAVVAADIDPAKGQVDMAIHSRQYISRRKLDAVADDLRTGYGLRKMQITASYPADQLTCVEPEDLMALFVKENSMHRGSLAGAQWIWEGECLTVKLLGNGVQQL
jgi:hypothetical protein